MRNRQIVAVSTGDIIGSTSLNDFFREKLNKEIHLGLDELLSDQSRREYEIMRGDSFQYILDNPSDALVKAVQLRAYFIKRSNPQSHFLIDARIAIGIGEVNYTNKSIGESDGTAFWLSGRGLDSMKGIYSKIFIQTKQSQTNAILLLYCELLETIIERWTKQQAEVVYDLILGKTQVDIAKKLKIQQSSVSYRARAANWNAVSNLLAFYSKFIEENS